MSAASPPEFFFDRSLGRATANALTAAGWRIHLIADWYPDDAGGVEDTQWIAEGTSRGWALLSKDKKIRFRTRELQAIGSGLMFCLANGDLTVRQMTERYLAAEASIRHHIDVGEPGFWHVYAHGRVERMWP